MGNVFNKKEEIRILCCGLDAAGKTTMLCTFALLQLAVLTSGPDKLQLGEVVTTIPTSSYQYCSGAPPNDGVQLDLTWRHSSSRTRHEQLALPVQNFTFLGRDAACPS